MIEFILKTRVKYVAIGIICLFFVILFLTSTGDNADDELVLDEINQRIISVRRREKLRSHESPIKNVVDFDVQFYSGKEAVQEVDNEKKPFQVHKIQITNKERVKADLKCQDAFSTFGRLLPSGSTFKFSVTDLFAKRHYWCHVRYGTSEYTFRAYGEGAPRDNNVISLHKEGAFINGVNYRLGAGEEAEEPDRLNTAKTMK